MPINVNFFTFSDLISFAKNSGICTQIPQVANNHGRLGWLLHTNRVELLPRMDRIHGDSEHPIIEIGVEAEVIYPRRSRKREVT